jgi:signal transduction histidine kinase
VTFGSFAARIFWSIVPAFVLFVVIQGWVNVREQRRLVTAEFIKRGEALVSHLASTSELAVFAEDAQLLGSSIRSAARDPDVAYVVIRGEDGRRLADGGRHVSAIAEPLNARVDRLGSRTVERAGEHMVELVAPIVSDAKKTADEFLIEQTSAKSPTAQIIGNVAVGLSLRGVDDHVSAYVRFQVLITAGFLILTTLGIYHFSRRITRPINRLTTQTQLIAAGDLDQQIAVRSRDEIGQLAGAFNGMTRALKANIDEKERVLAELQDLNRTLEDRIRQRTAELEERSRALVLASRHKSDFLANISHELRTPLNAILGFNELILGGVYGDLPADVRRPLTDIGKSGKHLLRLINDVLDLSKIEAGRMELALAECSVDDIVNTVRTYLLPLAAEKGLDFVTDVAPGLPLAYCDGKRITQCLMNLAGNAVKFTREGRVTISAAQNGDVFVFKVSDTGMGIAKDDIPNLFAEFRQADATIARDYGGTGLGLSITKKFVDMHGGSIGVESGQGQGSTFTFTIPVRAQGEVTT